jgi:hypothetical protein
VAEGAHLEHREWPVPGTSWVADSRGIRMPKVSRRVDCVVLKANIDAADIVMAQLTTRATSQSPDTPHLLEWPEARQLTSSTVMPKSSIAMNLALQVPC